MIWLQSILCALFLMAQFWSQANSLVAVVLLNILLAISCLGLLLTAPDSREADPKEEVTNNRNRNIIIVALIAIYIAASGAKLNGSSSGIWHRLADGEDPTAALIAGKPKDVRSDEWLVQTPWIWSQAAQHTAFPIANGNIGNGFAPLVTNLPARHWSMFLRPQMWGFFFLDRERAFALNWNFKWFGLVLGGFLFLRTISRGNNFLALTGALILFFCGYTQWFFSTPTCMPEMVAMFFFSLWGFHLLRAAKSNFVMVGAAVVLVIAIEQFAFCCYPRFQIPLLYLAGALLIVGHWNRSNERSRSTCRALCLTAALVLSGVFLWLWYREVAPTILETSRLIYPGQVISSGGGYSLARFFAPFLEFGLTQEHFPKSLVNASEAAGFLFLGPPLVAIVVRDIWQRRVDAILITIVVWIIFVFCFMTIGIPESVARATGWSYVASFRALLGIGVATVIGLVRYFARPADIVVNKVTGAIVAAALVPVLLLCLWKANLLLDHFARTGQVVAASIFFATVFTLIWQRFRVASCVLIFVPLFCANALVNPIGVGLPGITQSEMFRWLSAENSSSGRWLVAGDYSNRTCCLAQFVKATGANVLGGVRCTPDREMLNVLDPGHRYLNIYDRYARVCFVISNDPEPVFELDGPDNYRVRLPWRGDLLQRLGVDHILVVEQNTIQSPAGFERVGEYKGYTLLRAQR